SLVVIKNVKAEICDNCGEYYLDEATAIEINAKAEREMASREVEVFNLEIYKLTVS
ncbi:MAG: YgiT-type zinc finger protein, partial [Cytophagales bacterium]